MAVKLEKYSGTFGSLASPLEIHVKLSDFNYHSIDFLSEIDYNDLPDFAQAIFVEPAIADKEKIMFCEEFLKEYLINEDFRNKYKRQYLGFINRQYSGVFETISDIYAATDPKDKRLVVRIGLDKIGLF